MKKRLLALVLVLAMVMSLAACGSSNNDTNADPTPTTAGTDGTTDTPDPTDVPDGTDTPDDTTEGGNYTLNLALSTFPTNWNPHQYQTSTDGDLLTFLGAAFYTFDYNENKDGYVMVPYTITQDPVDVTADYAGQFGIEAGETARAWKLTLRDDLMWEDGTLITANDFVRSAELLLNPEAQNYRADSLYSGSAAVVNAKNFLYQGQHVYATPMIPTAAAEEYVAYENIVIDENGVFTVDGKDLAISLTDGATWGASVTDYRNFLVQGETDLYATVIEPAANAEGYVSVTQEVYEALLYFTAVAHGFASVEEYAAASGDYAYLEWEEFCFFGESYAEMDFSEVGLIAENDHDLVMVLEKPLEGFYLHYALTDSWLVNEALYLSCEDTSSGAYTNSYGTSVETTMSYGPYKLTAFQADKEYTLEKNENYFDQGEGLWQATKMVYNLVAEASTRLEMFLSGQLDSYGLTADDMETYSTSDYTYYATGSSTFYIAMNPNQTALENSQAALGANFNKTILTVKEFRQAICYALDRAAFCLATSPTNNPAFGLYSDLIICDPENGTGYRSTDEAKAVLAEFWGLTDEIGDGKMYATVDDAVDSITGYNLEMAKEYFNRAYEVAVEQGLMDADDIIEIKVGVPNSTSNFYSKGYEFLVNCYTDAVVGTSLEGKLTFTLDDTLGNGFGDALRANNVDLLFGVGWSGSALDPYNLMEAYTSTQYQYNAHWDTTAAPLTINLSGTDYTASVWEWTEMMMGEERTITAADGTTRAYKAGVSDDVDEERFQILVAIENAVLETYDLIPIMDNSTAQLRSMKVNYYSEEYIFGVGFHNGYRNISFNYTDEEWADFLASQGGKLNYN